ncbi:MAG: CoA transferase [SAR202 cluster bacterium]|nr:CoA transferase [SAR202 cluster bacterium]
MNDDNQPVTGPLHGLRVIDWTMWQFGPVSTMMLADMGAEVIKIESLDGDHGRHFESIRGRRAELEGDLSAYFEGMNRQKLGMALNLKTPSGVLIMHRLVRQSDVLVQNFRKGVAERLGLGYEDLIKHNSKLIYASASGYGPEGPDAYKPAFALTAEARAGALWWFGPDDDTPHELDIADQIAGMMLSYGVLGAIVYRERFGVGQKVDVSHLGSMIWARGMQNGISFLKDFEVPRFDRKEPGQVLWNYYRCQDGEWIAFSMGQGDRFWPTFCQAIDRPDLVTDPRFDTMTARFENRREVVAVLDDVFAGRPRAYWERRLDEAGDLIWERVQRNLDLLDDPQVKANDYVIEYDHPVIGPSKWAQTPVSYSETPLHTRKMAPALGENTEEILIDLLGYTWDDIAAMRDEGAIL